MSARVCQFCGLYADVGEEKPARGSCVERGGTLGHVWTLDAAVDDEVRAELNASTERRHARMRGAIAGALVEVAEGEADEAIARAEQAMAAGDSEAAAIETQIARLSAPPLPSEPPAEPTVTGWRCDYCGLPAADPQAEAAPPEGGCGARSGEGHAWERSRSLGREEELSEKWETIRTVKGGVADPRVIDRLTTLLQAGVPYLAAYQRATQEIAAEKGKAPEDPGKLPDDSSSPTPAPRKRGRPPKVRPAASSAPIVLGDWAVGEAAAPSRSPSPAAPSDEPAQIGGVEPEPAFVPRPPTRPRPGSSEAEVRGEIAKLESAYETIDAMVFELAVARRYQSSVLRKLTSMIGAKLLELGVILRTKGGDA